jgi:hypothetical protein
LFVFARGSGRNCPERENDHSSWLKTSEQGEAGSNDAKKKPKVYITRKLPDVVETRMRELFDAELNIDDTPRTRPNLWHGDEAGRRAGAHGHRPDRRGADRAGRTAAEADRQLFEW